MPVSNFGGSLLYGQFELPALGTLDAAIYYPPPPVCKDCFALVKSDSRYLFRLQCIQVICYKYGERLLRLHREMSQSLKKCLYLSKHAWT